LWDEDLTGSGSESSASRPAALSEAGVPRSPDKIIYLYICRRDERRINGSDLLDAAIKAGLNFGEMNIFHRRQEGVKQPVFSMANLTKPGYFDPGSWNVFDTPGVTLFLTLPAPVSALDAWDAMHATAQRLAELLEADVLDDGKCLLTRQRIAQIREEMREYDRINGLIGAPKGGVDGG
jgi:cell division protein ZipA